jgi:hypothetical protein
MFGEKAPNTLTAKIHEGLRLHELYLMTFDLPTANQSLTFSTSYLDAVRPS